MRRHRRLSARVVVLVASVVFVASARQGGADSDKRQQLIDEINRLLIDMASELRDVPGDSSTSHLDHTIESASRVSDKARELKDQAGGDSTASSMGSSYPDIARRYQDAARYLRELKNGYRRIDEWPKKCETTMRELGERLRAYTDTHDPRGLEEVPKLARESGKVGKEGIEAAERAKNEMYTWNDKVDDFSDGDGKWSDVRSNLISDGRTMYEYTVKQWEQVKRDDTCGNLAKEDRNPLIEQAMSKLFEGKKGIETLYEALDRQLGEIASMLDGLVGDSDDSDVTSAERKLDEIDRLLDQLDRSKGNDGEARRRVDTWRNISRASRTAMTQLHTLKQSQFRVDKAPAKCKDADDKLDAEIREIVGQLDRERTDEIPQRARGIAAPIKEALVKADELHQTMERAQSDAIRFDASEGRWRAVTEKTREAATAIFEYWKKAREVAHASCDELAKGDQSTAVKRAVADLSRSRSNNQTELDRIKNDHARWYDGVKELREWYKQDTENVRQGLCNLEASPGDMYEGDAYLETLDKIADRMVARIAPRWSELESVSTALIERLKKLEAVGTLDIKNAATKLREAIERTERGMFLVMSTELKGRNDAELRAFIEVGRNEHKRIQADSSKCEVSEITIPGEGQRIDCVRVSSARCYIVEIKPNNSKAQSRGADQLSKYKNSIRNLFESKKDHIDDTFTDKLSIFKRCIANGKIALDSELRVYDFCPADGKLFNDFVVQ